MKLTFLALLLTFSLSGQSWEFNQGYILEDSTLTIILKPIDVTVLPNLIILNDLEIMYDRLETRQGVTTYHLSNGGVLLYTESPSLGPGIAMLYANIRIVAWSNIRETFQIDLK